MHENTIFQSLYQVLKNDDAVKALVTNVYQFPPPEREYPYLLLELVDVQADNGLKQGRGQQSFQVEVHIISEYNGIKEVNAIADAAQTALEKTLVVGSGTIVLKFKERIITGQQDTKQQRIRLSTLQFQGLHRF